MSIKHITVALLTIIMVATQCLKGGLISQQGQCFYPQYIQGCLQYSNIKNQCLQCQYNYRKWNNICIFNTSSVASDCCSKFNPQSICTQCSRGLTTNPSSGLCVDQKITGCIQKDKQGCAVCARDYNLVGKKCLRSINNCVSYDSNYQCISCQNNCILSNGVCVLKTQISKISQCAKANEFGCYECFQGYRPSNGLCVQVQFFGCLRYDQNGRCLSCDSPYYYLSNGRCLITGCLQYQGKFCKKCNSAFGFIIASNRCQIPNCIYFGDRGCTTCKNNLIASSSGCREGNNKVCIICKNDEYLSKNGQCLKRNVHCNLYKDGICTSCCDRYYLNNNNQCIPKANGCIYNNGRCQSCQNPFVFANYACIIQGCLSYNEHGCEKCHQKLLQVNYDCKLPFCRTFNQQYVCTQCIQGYQLNGNTQCVQVDPFCQRRNALNSCITCKPNYTLNTYGRCVSMKVGCNYVDGRCTSCRAPFNYIPQSESCFIDGCLQYFIGGCSKCQSSYKLLYNSCKLPNCLISKNSKCIECDPDFIFNSNGLCVSKDEFCDKMDEYGTCIKCMNSYFYSLKLQRCVKKAQGCIYNNKDQCYACESPFNYDNGRCTIVGCISYVYEGCYQCSYPYLLSKDRTCYISNCAKIDNNVCVQCQKGYTLDDKNLCKVADKNCLQFDENQTKCTKCTKGYALDENNRCQYKDQYCNYFDKNGFCVNCDRLYFVNPQAKCQLRDPQCLVYNNGYCSRCKPYHFVNNGICFANLKGCRQQRAYGDCRKCDQGYNLENGLCKAQITKLSWNSVDMDFWQNGDKESSEVFSYNMTNKLSLVQAIRGGNAKIYYSSSNLNNAQFQIDTEGGNGWSPSGKNKIEYIGVETSLIQTFYAFEIKPLAGCESIQFNIEYSFDGINFEVLDTYYLTNYVLGVAKIFYIKPVEAKFIRIILKSGLAHFKLEFYYSNTNYQSSKTETKTYISKTVTQIIDGVQGGISTCQDSKLCWAGVETCEPTKLIGFQLIYTNDSTQNYVKEVKIDYSLDGMRFTCYDNCKAFVLTNNKLIFESPILAEKVHVHFTNYVGNPKFGIKYNWLFN